MSVPKRVPFEALLKGWYRQRTRKPDTECSFAVSGSRSESSSDVTVTFRSMDSDELDACRKLRVQMTPETARRLATMLLDQAAFAEGEGGMWTSKNGVAPSPATERACAQGVSYDTTEKPR